MPQLKAYHRPATIEEALKLLSRPGAAVIGGGAYLIPHLPDSTAELVDLQAVAGLDQISHTGQRLTLGAMVRLQSIVEDEQAPSLLREAALREGPNTLRNAATVGGVVAGPDPESELLAALLLFEAQVQLQASGGSKTLSLVDFLADVSAALNGSLITAVSLPTTGRTASARVARTPADKAIVAALARLDNGGPVRLALCGVDTVPVLVDPVQVKASINPPGDFRGSKEYRRQMAATLAGRVLAELTGND